MYFDAQDELPASPSGSDGEAHGNDFVAAFSASLQRLTTKNRGSSMNDRVRLCVRPGSLAAVRERIDTLLNNRSGRGWTGTTDVPVASSVAGHVLPSFRCAPCGCGRGSAWWLQERQAALERQVSQYVEQDAVIQPELPARCLPPLFSGDIYSKRFVRLSRPPAGMSMLAVRAPRSWCCTRTRG